MVKDMMGHDLKEGDWITVKHLLNDVVAGRIVAVSEGGLLATVQNPQQSSVMPGSLRVQLEVVLQFNPTAPISVLKLVPPPDQKGQGNA